MDKIPPEPSLLQVEQCQLSQPLSIGEMLLSLNHLIGLSLDSSLASHLIFASPEMDTILQWCSGYGLVSA